MGLVPAGTARLPHLINTKNSSKRLSPSAGTTPTLNLPCFTGEIIYITKEIIHICLDILLLVFRFLCVEQNMYNRFNISH
jgi:hypothetical protein